MSIVKENYEKATLCFSKLNTEDGDIVIISFPTNINYDQMKEFSEQIQTFLPEGVSVLCTSENVDIKKLPTAQLNELGWYKYDTSKIN